MDVLRLNSIIFLSLSYILFFDHTNMGFIFSWSSLWFTFTPQSTKCKIQEVKFKSKMWAILFWLIQNPQTKIKSQTKSKIKHKIQQSIKNIRKE